MLKMVTDPLATRPAAAALPFWQIGADGGFLPAPASLNQLLMGLAERADVIVDFTGLPVGTEIYLINEGPDEPFGGGVPETDFASADPGTTGQVMKLVVVALNAPDTSTPLDQLSLPPRVPLGPASYTRQVSLNEEESVEVCVKADPNTGEFLFPINQIKKVLPGPKFADDCAAAGGVPFGPTMALLGTVDPHTDIPSPLHWADAITENPVLGATEIWEIHNHTEDAHPIHIHMVQFEVLDRTPMGDQIGGPTTRGPEPWETGTKDTSSPCPTRSSVSKRYTTSPASLSGTVTSWNMRTTR
jgi:bilirubin oxidase